MRARNWSMVGLGLVLAAALPMGAAQGALAPQRWATDGGVDALAGNGTTLYVGGTFSRIGRPTGGGAVVDATSGLARPGEAIDGTVTAATPDGHGGWFVAGHLFTRTTNGVAHVRADGSVDPRFRGSMGGRRRVWALALRGDTLYVGGLFPRLGGERRTNLGALSATTGAVRPFAPRIRGTVRALAVSGSRLYVGGDFDRIDATRVRGLAAFRDCRLDAGFRARVGGPVAALVTARRSLLLGGSFGRVGSHGRGGLARVELDSGRVLPWAPKANGAVAHLATDGSAVVVSGTFTTVNRRARAGVAAVALPSGRVLPFAPSGATANDPVAIRRGTVYAGGSAFSLRTSDRTGWSPVSGGTVHVVSAAHGAVYVGGELALVGGLPRPGLAAIETTTGTVTRWSPTLTGPVLSLGVAGGTVYAGGPRSADGAPRASTAAFDTTTGAATPWSPPLPGARVDAPFVTAIVTDGDGVLLGGQFDYQTPGGVGENLARVDATTGALVPGFRVVASDPLFPVVSRLDRIGATIYLNGSFDAVDGAPRRNLAAVDAASGALLPWAPDLGPDSARASAASETAVYVLDEGAIVALDPATGASTGFRTTATFGENVDTMIVVAGRLLVAGTVIDATTGAVEPGTPLPFGGGLGPVGREETAYAASASVGGRLYVGGNFGLVGVADGTR